ncbi:MAG: peroxide stress protein YaaA [Phenylobacterium sp.]|uniref:peroxide stress protein YaaA n=1 Tax=Phenylobacterium sp. TaxID=1871053 RepID=UPI002600F707|nr:peroxide stress protein YaaA [Phenylobacterium sp.]MBA4012650.1 peroxide stress protein YaaA [Phenylobacterium sp.]
MLIVISPAKALDFTRPDGAAPMTTPQMAEDIAELSLTAKKLKVADLKKMMDLSDKLAELNRERFAAFDPAMEDGLQAAFAFNGDVYSGLKARELNKKGLNYAQKHLRILSGLYGVLRPLDAIQPYRLEMGVRIKTKRGASLYDFWGDKIAGVLNEAGAGHKDPTLVNCASQEYFGAVDRAAIKLPVVTAKFFEEKDGSSKIISFYAKKARGLMARYAIDHGVEKAEDLKAFDVEGYRFQKSASSDTEWVFSRPQPPPPSAAKKQKD